MQCADLSYYNFSKTNHFSTHHYQISLQRIFKLMVLRSSAIIGNDYSEIQVKMVLLYYYVMNK